MLADDDQVNTTATSNTTLKDPKVVNPDGTGIMNIVNQDVDKKPPCDQPLSNMPIYDKSQDDKDVIVDVSVLPVKKNDGNGAGDDVPSVPVNQPVPNVPVNQPIPPSGNPLNSLIQQDATNTSTVPPVISNSVFSIPTGNNMSMLKPRNPIPVSVPIKSNAVVDLKPKSGSQPGSTWL